MKIIVGDFCLKTFFKHPEKVAVKPQFVLEAVQQCFDQARKGYREGVLLVPLPLQLEGVEIFDIPWDSPIVQLSGGEYLFGKYESRVKGEEPRKTLKVLGGTKAPVVSVDAVLYSRAVLEESGDKVPEGVDYEIVAILTKITEGDQPMPVETLIANFYKLSGGTDTRMSDSEFVTALRESVMFWKDKAMIYEK